MKLDTGVAHQRLTNGMTFHLLDPDTNLNTVEILAVVKTGASSDPASKCGIAHLLEHMTLSGNSMYNKLVRNDIVSSKGIYSNAYTSSDATIYLLLGPTVHFEFMLKMMYLDLFEATYREEDTITEREVVATEIKMRDDNQGSKFYDFAIRTAYPKNPYGRCVGGSINCVKNITSDDLKRRERIKHVGSNIEIIVGGNYDKLKLEKAIGSLYSQVKSGKPEKLIEPPLWGCNLVSKHNETTANNAYLGYIFHDDIDSRQCSTFRASIDAAISILGVGTSSRMWKELREKRGLCYACGAEHNVHRGFGNTILWVNCDTANLARTFEHLRSILKKYTKNGVTAKELNTYREHARNLTYRTIDDLNEYISLCAHNYIVERNDWETLRMYMDALDKITVDNVNSAIYALLSRQRVYLEQKQTVGF